MVFGLGLEASLLVGAVSLFLLVFGAEEVVARMKAIAAYYKIPDVVIAASVISIGTSLPELAAHIIASVGILSGTLNYEIASATVLGANIGSDVVQQTLVVGLVILSFIAIQVKRTVAFDQPWKAVFKDISAAVNSATFTFEEDFLKKDYLPMIGTTLMTTVLAWDGVLSRLDGVVLLASFAGYMYFIFHTRKERLDEEAAESDNVRLDATVALISMVAVILSAHIILNVAERLVAVTGLGGSIIGVMTIGIISAFPEMFTAIEGLRQKASGISLGTLIGSNIVNPLLAIGFGSLLSTYWVPRPLVLWDLPMETITAAILLAYLLFVSDRKLGWKGGLYLVGLYVFYVVIRFSYFAID